MAQKTCGNCGRTDDNPHFISGMRRWSTLMCPCGVSHDFCVLCYKILKGRGIIVGRGQRGGGKKEFLKGCPKEVRIADVLMREDRKVDREATNL